MIHNLILQGSIVINPFKYTQLNPNSYNLTLGDKLLVYRDHYLDCKRENPVDELWIGEGFTLHPGKVYLGSTIENTETKHHIPCIEGRSSLGRLGLDIHATAGFGDIGFCGTWTLELSVKQPLRIYAGMEVCQICYHEITGRYIPYTGRYQDQVEVTPSKYHL